MAKQRLEIVAPTAPPPVWASLRNEAERAAREEPALASLLNTVILSHDHLADALSFQLARKLLPLLRVRLGVGPGVGVGVYSMIGIGIEVELNGN